MKTNRLLLVPAISLCLFTSALAQSVDTSATIDHIFAAWTSATPGGSVLVARGDNILYHKAFGLAEMEHRVPNQTSTIFEAGSVSKQFVAAAILLLAKDGKLSLDDDARKYVPELPEHDAPITIRHLFSHTSGLKDWGTIGALAGWARTTRAYTQELAMHILTRQKTTNFPVGTQYSYSNSNYTMLVEIVRRVSGMSLADFTEQRIFRPLGMEHTQWRDNFHEIVPGRSTAYQKYGDEFQELMPFEDVHGHGGLLTTTGDLLIWNRVLTDGSFFGEELSRERITSGLLNDGKPVNYAAGLSLGAVNGVDEISHSGATAGYRAWLAYYPDKDLSVAVLSNDGSFSPVPAGKSIAEIYLGKPQAAATSPSNNDSPTAPYTPTTEQLRSLAGTYHSDEAEATFRIEVNAGGEVRVHRKPGDVFLLEPEAEDLFIGRREGSYRFLRDASGNVTGFEVSLPRAERMEFVRVED